jgi:hypothetical protein
MFLTSLSQVAVRCGEGASLRQLDVRNINNDPVLVRDAGRILLRFQKLVECFLFRLKPLESYSISPFTRKKRSNFNAFLAPVRRTERLTLRARIFLPEFFFITERKKTHYYNLHVFFLFFN